MNPATAELADGLTPPRRRGGRTWRCGSSSSGRSRRGAPVADLVELEQTRACVRAWNAGEDLLEHLSGAVCEFEAGQPEISATKLAGLSAHYGHGEEGPATEYFRVHELRDVEHASAARELIARLIAESERSR